jgi:hypothetical protein
MLISFSCRTHLQYDELEQHAVVVVLAAFTVLL